MSFAVRRGEIYGVVGESRSGKTILGLTILGLLAHSLGIEGDVLFEGKGGSARVPFSRAVKVLQLYGKGGEPLAAEPFQTAARSRC